MWQTAMAIAAAIMGGERMRHKPLMEKTRGTEMVRCNSTLHRCDHLSCRSLAGR
jgi:hypothetical protein